MNNDIEVIRLNSRLLALENLVIILAKSMLELLRKTLTSCPPSYARHGNGLPHRPDSPRSNLL